MLEGILQTEPNIIVIINWSDHQDIRLTGEYLSI